MPIVPRITYATRTRGPQNRGPTTAPVRPTPNSGGQRHDLTPGSSTPRQQPTSRPAGTPASVRIARGTAPTPSGSPTAAAARRTGRAARALADKRTAMNRYTVA